MPDPLIESLQKAFSLTFGDQCGLVSSRAWAGGGVNRSPSSRYGLVDFVRGDAEFEIASVAVVETEFGRG